MSLLVAEVDRLAELAAGLALDEFTHAGASVFQGTFLAPGEDLRRAFILDDVVEDVADGSAAASDLSEKPILGEANAGLTNFWYGVFHCAENYNINFLTALVTRRCRASGALAF